MHGCMYVYMEDNLSPFDLNIACLCQSIEINNNKHVCMNAYNHIENILLGSLVSAPYVLQRCSNVLDWAKSVT